MEQGLGYILAIMAEYVSILEGIGFLAGEMLVYHEPTGAIKALPMIGGSPLIKKPNGFTGASRISVGIEAGLVEDVHWFLFPCTCPCFQHLLLTTVGKVGK